MDPLPASLDSLELRQRRAHTGALELHVVEAGAGPPVLLLHGFPEFWYSWRHQLGPLAAAGFRAVAPDLRGYGQSDKPRAVGDYAIEHLVADVRALVLELGGEPVTLVGHDWGGALAWEVALRCPELVRRLAILNAPHPLSMQRALRTWRQLRKSWYMLFFQLPRLPERWLLQGESRRMRSMLRRDPVRPDAFAPEDIERYVEAIQRPGAARGAIHWYRAALRRLPGAARAPWTPVEAPVLVIWGEADRYLGPELAQPPARWAPRAEVVRLPAASHWVQVDAAARVSELLVEFARGERDGAPHPAERP